MFNSEAVFYLVMMLTIWAAYLMLRTRKQRLALMQLRQAQEAGLLPEMH